MQLKGKGKKIFRFSGHKGEQPNARAGDHYGSKLHHRGGSATAKRERKIRKVIFKENYMFYIYNSTAAAATQISVFGVVFWLLPVLVQSSALITLCTF